ncbi:hypothetical protein AAFF_G00422870 [Aldrovandia affinis]|uniref:Uncharacterized protein n=1 Tax=Aldrovandia affinis TaxID=143900 RepID=A0AAD7T6P0_9TELE|nr:hypothetical protein AAFF_G00422870 [Aldrovandia affinis]
MVHQCHLPHRDPKEGKRGERAHLNTFQADDRFCGRFAPGLVSKSLNPPPLSICLRNIQGKCVSGARAEWEHGVEVRLAESAAMLRPAVPATARREGLTAYSGSKGTRGLLSPDFR